MPSHAKVSQGLTSQNNGLWSLAIFVLGENRNLRTIAFTSRMTPFLMWTKAESCQGQSRSNFALQEHIVTHSSAIFALGENRNLRKVHDCTHVEKDALPDVDKSRVMPRSVKVQLRTTRTYCNSFECYFCFGREPEFAQSPRLRARRERRPS